MAFLQKPLYRLRGISENRVHISGGPNFAFDLAARKTSDDDMAGLDLGDVLHILTPNEDTTAILDAVRAAGVADASIAPIAPTLEDVFISLTSGHSAERG